MVYTLTFNPSLDYFVCVEDFKIGVTNRTSKELILPGGKGINVSIVLGNMGIDNCAVYYSSGFVGAEITRRIEEYGVTSEAIVIPGENSRINVKLQNYEGTEINGKGPFIAPEYVDVLYKKLDKIKEEDYLVLAGSIPDCIDDKIYADIMNYLKDRNVKIIVDTTGDRLLNVLKYRPFLIKPNNHELGDLFGINIKTREQVISNALKLHDMGAKNVIVSMAGDGAVFIDGKGNIYDTKAPKGKLVNGVGAGDSLVAGFITGYIEKADYEYAFKFGVATGSASAFSESLASRDDAMKLYKTIC